MLTFATSRLGITEADFWQSTPRKFRAMMDAWNDIELALRGKSKEKKKRDVAAHSFFF